MGVSAVLGDSRLEIAFFCHSLSLMPEIAEVRVVAVSSRLAIVEANKSRSPPPPEVTGGFTPRPLPYTSPIYAAVDEGGGGVGKQSRSTIVHTQQRNSSSNTSSTSNTSNTSNSSPSSTSSSTSSQQCNGIFVLGKHTTHRGTPDAGRKIPRELVLVKCRPLS